MKSRITIEADFEQNSPFILVKEDCDPINPDTRDSLVKVFSEKTGYTSSWARIERPYDNDARSNRTLKIYPITPAELIYQGEQMMKMGLLEKNGGVDIDQLSLEELKA